MRVVKHNLLQVPPLFTMIQESAGTDWREMYQVFNMGQRLEIFTDESTAKEIVKISESFGIPAQVSGYVEASATKEVVIESEHGRFVYN